MKKKIIIIISTALLIALVISAVFSIDMYRMKNNKPVVFSTWGYDYAPPIEITPQTAIEKVRKKLDEENVDTITNFDNPKIEEIVFDTQPSIYYFEDRSNVVGRTLYRITFNTTQDGLLGPMVFYVDKLSGDLIGIEYRY